MEKLIYLENNSLPNELCEEIIEMFENDDSQYDGVTASGLNKKIKNTRDLIIPNNDKWNKILNVLTKELHRNLNLYIKSLKTNLNDYAIFSKHFLYENSFQIQRYRKNEGKYIYHHDHDIRFDQKDHRVITYLWYLNTVEEGGQTEIWKTIKVKPEQGKLLLFPASWTFPHSGLIPISNDKYIITGWLYENRSNE
jgi:Rps23 Pro-64 3,4-dihydroxylase Tpa1-like proline 4-hydroxylase